MGRTEKPAIYTKSKRKQICLIFTLNATTSHISTIASHTPNIILPFIIYDEMIDGTEKKNT